MNSSKNGLKDKEAKRRLEFQGKNKLQETKKECLFKKIINSILDPMIIMLLITAVISAVISAARGEKFTDVFIILFVGCTCMAYAKLAIDTASTSHTHKYTIMDLQDAINAVDTYRKTGDNVFGNDSNKWSWAEHLLTDNGDSERAEVAHNQAVRAYRHEEWGAGLL